MDILYEVTVEKHFDLDVDKLVQIIIDDYGPLDSDIMYYWGDNMELFLSRVGFHNYDSLGRDLRNDIYDVVYNKLKSKKNT